MVYRSKLKADVTCSSLSADVFVCAWLQESIRESDIDEFLMGMASQIAEREDHIVTPDLHGHVFGTLDFSRRDLMAVNIQRGREHGLPDYNTAREFFGLKRRNSFDEINTSNEPPSLKTVCHPD